MSRSADGAAPIILFDGVCVLCSSSVRFILRQDAAGTMRIAAMQSPVGQALLARHGLPLTDPETFYILTDGGVLAKSRALLFVAARLRRPWRWLGAIGVLPERWLDAGYAVVARRRYRIAGRRQTCLAPTPEERARFIE